MSKGCSRLENSWSMGHAAGDRHQETKGMAGQIRVEGLDCKVKEAAFNPYDRARKIHI